MRRLKKFDEQFSNAQKSKFFPEEGIEISFNEKQILKALCPIEVTLD